MISCRSRASPSSFQACGRPERTDLGPTTRYYTSDKRQCALTNSHVLHVLDAAHIKPYALGGSHSPSNGLLLRQDVHTLFDRGYLTVTPDYHVEVSHRLKDEFDNGKEYYALQGKRILVPDDPSFRPSPQQLAWHNESRYRP